MNRLKPLLKASEFIEENLRELIGVGDMARAAGYSLYYFIRLFSAKVFCSPYDHLIRRRMTLAAFELLETDRRIIDVALDHGFESHEGFTRAFTRLFGKTPSAARESGSLAFYRGAPPLTLAHFETLDSCAFEPGKSDHRAKRLPKKTVDVFSHQPGMVYSFSKEWGGNWGEALVFKKPPEIDWRVYMDCILYLWLFSSGYDLAGNQIAADGRGEDFSVLLPLK